MLQHTVLSASCVMHLLTQIISVLAGLSGVMLLYLWGSCIAYLVIIGDSFASIISLGTGNCQRWGCSHGIHRFACMQCDRRKLKRAHMHAQVLNALALMICAVAACCHLASCAFLITRDAGPLGRP